jgi:hypothetical protein
MSADAEVQQQSTVRLWTFQRDIVASTLASGEVYRASWAHTPANWRLAYWWMAGRLAAKSPLDTNAPIWCWHSCNGCHGAAPTVGTARKLLSDYDVEQGMVTLELLVPIDLPLLSSYYAWNTFLEKLVTRKRSPCSRRKQRRMFEPPLFKHADDDIQAVIPYIAPNWVRRISTLTIDGRDWDEPVMDGSPPFKSAH